MRIFHVCADRGIPPDGSKGASVHLRCIARALSDLGHDVTTFTRRKAESEAAFPVSLRSLDPACEALREGAAEARPDVILERYSLDHRESLAAARELGVPFVLEVNAPLVEETRRHRPGRLTETAAETEALLLREADLLACVSEPLRSWAAGQRGRSEGTLLLPNGCEPELYPEPAHGDAAGDPVIVFLGHPKPWHGAERLPEILAALAREGCPARGLILGGGPGAEQVQARARALGVAERLEISGPLSREDAARRLLEGTLMLAPYPPQEPFYFCPLKVVEGMAAGLPVVASDLGDVPDLLGGTGLVVPAGDDAAFVAAIRDLLRDPGRRRSLGQRSRVRALVELSWPARAKLLTQHMRLLVEKAA